MRETKIGATGATRATKARKTRSGKGVYTRAGYRGYGLPMGYQGLLEEKKRVCMLVNKHTYLHTYTLVRLTFTHTYRPAPKP